ncbi:MAG: hypothetical protein P8O16_05720 [Algoriphagus sp.]|jgi:hypothetical protein|uniref:hypothetical protein n=1 Tax=Algoriphagus sp. TaxID=1872435 RepID=UPI0026187B18|nr:hypothetical protein [Algoriphagus sp.]MDG1276760.1 hypothetical protein [Algoriphagus sp.]
MRVPKSSFKFPRFFLMVVALQLGCTGTSSDEAANTNEIQLEEDKISKMKNQLDITLAQKESWYTHWKNILGPFDSSDFELVMTDSIDPMEMPERNPILPDDPLFPYQYSHPAGNGTMDIYSYKIEAQEAVETPFLNPDSEVIWYRSDGMKERLLFMGPSGMFEEGEWLNEDEFIVLGYFQEEQGFRPMAWIINIATHRIVHFNLSKLSKTYEADSYIDQKIKQVSLN